MEREAIRALMAPHVARGAARLLRGCILRPQSRFTSTDAQDGAAAAVLSDRRVASSWSGGSGDRSPVTKELGSRGFLQRSLPETPASAGEKRDSQTRVARYFIDTQAMVRALEDGGYSRQQAESVVNLVSTSLSDSLDPLVEAQITRKDMELLEVQFAGEVDSLRSSLVLLERSTIDSLRHENEGLRSQIRKLHERLKEEVKKLESGLQLEMNLEKSRLREESTDLSQKIRDTHNRIETEVAQLKTQIEAQKLESIKYLAGGIVSVVTIVLSLMLGLSRLLK